MSLSEHISLKFPCLTGKSKDQIKEEEEKIIRQVVEEKMDIRGGYAKPKITDVLWIQIVFLPYTIYKWIHFYTRWFYKFGIKKEEYGEEEKLYLIRKFMNVSQTQFDVSFDTSKNREMTICK